MDMLISVFIGLTALSAMASANDDVVIPPSITRGPLPATVYFTNKEGTSVPVPCYAVGNPTPKIKWKLNDSVMEGETRMELILDRNAQPGNYQCSAYTTEYGTAVSNITQIIEAKQASFVQEANPTRRTATLGESLSVECKYRHAGIPTPRINDFVWKHSSNNNPVTLSGRVQTDDFGSLHFAAITEAERGLSAKCFISNTVWTIDAGGSETRIDILPGDRVPPRQPTILFYSNKTSSDAPSSTVIALEGEDVRLRCFFAGSDRIEVHWRRADGVKFETGRTDENIFGTELLIKKVVESDERDYVCYANSEEGTTEFTIKLIVNVAPRFESNDDRPRNVNASVGDDVTFLCRTRAKPPATIQWFKNGQKISREIATTDPKLAKFRWSDDLTTLTIEKLCKRNCTGVLDPDMMVIQCNASNQFNYTFSNGYINVFEKTVFTRRPPEALIVDLSSTVSLSAHAQSDPTTPVTYEWYRNDRRLFPDGDRIQITTDETGNAGTNLTINNLSDEDLVDYECRATNGISTARALTEIKTPAQVAAMWPYWWVPLLVLILFMLVIAFMLAVACFIYRNRGEDYPVDETERKQGNNPEQDLEDADFQPFQRKETGSDAGSTISRSTLDRRGGSKEDVGLIGERRGSAGGTFD